jgi:DNA-binding TFAR19-related protein (PDSD5 family)
MNGDGEAEIREKQGFSGHQKSERFFSELTEQVLSLEKVAKTMMTREAISRYGNLKMAHTETAIKAIAMIAQAVQTRQIKDKLTDEQFKELLREIQNNKKQFTYKK